MQEHIRRAHPEHYISKLPATEESFHLMINTPPSDRPQQQQSSGQQQHHNQNKNHNHGYHHEENNAPGTPRNLDEYQGGSLLPAAAALAQLHNHKSESTWELDAVRLAPSLQNTPFCFAMN